MEYQLFFTLLAVLSVGVYAVTRLVIWAAIKTGLIDVTDNDSNADSL